MDRIIVFFIIGFLLGIILTASIALHERAQVVEDMREQFDLECRDDGFTILNKNFNISIINLT